MVTPSFQYPHLLYRRQVTESQQLPNGSWTEPTDTWVLHKECREETNGKGAQINTADGRVLAFSSLIQLPKDIGRIDEGTEVIVTTKVVQPDQLKDVEFINTAKQEGTIQAQGACLKFDSNRLHCRIWI